MRIITLGNRIANFSVKATSQKIISNDSIKNKKFVFYFYPKDKTPGCTNESKNFRDLYGDFKKNNTEIFGISKDSLKMHEEFKKELDLPFELIADSDEKLCQIFDVLKQKNMFGKQYMGIERSTFLFDEKAILRHEWRKVKVNDHAKVVLEAVKKNH